jgi:hypothetical protein
MGCRHVPLDARNSSDTAVHGRIRTETCFGKSVGGTSVAQNSSRVPFDSNASIAGMGTPRIERGYGEAGAKCNRPKTDNKNNSL